jgi:hypothetical protein
VGSGTGMNAMLKRQDLSLPGIEPQLYSSSLYRLIYPDSYLTSYDQINGKLVELLHVRLTLNHSVYLTYDSRLLDGVHVAVFGCFFQTTEAQLVTWPVCINTSQERRRSIGGSVELMCGPKGRKLQGNGKNSVAGSLINCTLCQKLFG